MSDNVVNLFDGGDAEEPSGYIAEVFIAYEPGGRYHVSADRDAAIEGLRETEGDDVEFRVMRANVPLPPIEDATVDIG